MLNFLKTAPCHLFSGFRFQVPVFKRFQRFLHRPIRRPIIDHDNLLRRHRLVQQNPHRLSNESRSVISWNYDRNITHFTFSNSFYCTAIRAMRWAFNVLRKRSHNHGTSINSSRIFYGIVKNIASAIKHMAFFTPWRSRYKTAMSLSEASADSSEKQCR